MMMRTRSLHRIVRIELLSLVAASALAAQARTVPAISLNKGAAEFPEPFSKLRGLIELRDGRVVVLESAEKELRLVDVTRGVMSKIGRVGGGPLEYRIPGILVPGAADTVTYYDVLQHRFLLLSPTGAPVRTVTFGGSDLAAMPSLMQPAGVDALGHVYGQTFGMKLPTDQKATSLELKLDDTVTIQSFDRTSGKAKALARIRNSSAASEPKVTMAGGTMKMTVNAPDFRPADVWTVLPDGRLVIMRDGVYRARFVAASGGETVGPLLSFTPIPVNAVEKRAAMDSLRKEMQKGMAEMQHTIGEAAASTGVDMSNVKIPKFDMQVVEPAQWATTKPAYTGLQSSPDGRLWVSLSTPAGTKSMRFDILNGAGALLVHVELAPGETLAGLGRNTVYTIRTDQDDLQYLRRYLLPRLP